MTNEEIVKRREKIKFLWFWQLLLLPFQLASIILAVIILSPFLLITELIEFIEIIS